MKKIFTARKAVTNTAIVGALSIAAIGVVTPMAGAYQSDTNDGCFSTWGNTGTDAHCTNPFALVNGNYSNHADCDFESDPTSGKQYYYFGQVVNDFGQLNCTFNVTSSYVLVWPDTGGGH